MECIEALVRHGADLDAARLVRALSVHVCWMAVSCALCERQDGATPMCFAAQEGHMECIEALARHGADVNKGMQVRYTYCCAGGEARVGLGVMVRAPSMQDGTTAAYFAAWKGHVECIEALVRHGADVNAARRVRVVGVHVCWMPVSCELYERQDGATPIVIAAQKGHVECIEALARHGADVNKATQVQ